MIKRKTLNFASLDIASLMILQVNLIRSYLNIIIISIIPNQMFDLLYLSINVIAFLNYTIIVLPMLNIYEVP